MRFSLYTSILYIENTHTLFYNALSGKVVFVKNKIFDRESFCVEYVRTHFPTLYSQLIEIEAIVSDDLDEKLILIERIEKSQNNSDNFILHINPTLDCNFKCWYCYEKHVVDSIMSDQTIKSVKKFIARQIKNQKDLRVFDLGFFGGEPLLKFDQCVKPIVKFCSKACSDNNIIFRLQFTSNGMLLNENIISFLAKYNCSFQITLDGGKEFHNKTRFSVLGDNSFDSIVNNIRLLVENNISVIVRVNYTSKNINSVPDIINKFANIDNKYREFLTFDFQRVWQDRNGKVDDTELLISKVREDFEKIGFAVATNYIYRSAERPCYGDKLNHLLINYDGNLFGCTARDFTVENSIGYLNDNGEPIYNEKYKLRNASKLSHSECKNCKVAPICGSGCKQRAFESMNVEQGCPMFFSDDEKENMILDIVLQMCK